MDEAARRRVEETSPGPIEAPPRVYSLTEAGRVLGMKTSNVGKYLARHGVGPAFKRAQGHLYLADVIDRLAEQRAADKEKAAADERRRIAATTGVSTRAPRVPRVRLGRAQVELMETMLSKPLVVEDEPTRYAILRLRRRGLVEAVPDAAKTYVLSDAGREAVANR